MREISLCRHVNTDILTHASISTLQDLSAIIHVYHVVTRFVCVSLPPATSVKQIETRKAWKCSLCVVLQRLWSIKNDFTLGQGFNSSVTFPLCKLIHFLARGGGVGAQAAAPLITKVSLQ